MIVSGGYGLIEYWNSSGEELESIGMHHNDLHVQSLIAIRDLLYSGGRDGNIMAWNENGKHIHTIMKAHSGWISCLLEHKGMLISGSSDNIIKCWSLLSYECIMTLRGHSNDVECLAVYGNYMLSGSRDRTMKLWDLNGSIGCCLQTFKHKDSVRSILNIMDEYIVSGDGGGRMYVWSIKGELIQTFDAHSCGVIYLGFCYEDAADDIYGYFEDGTIKKFGYCHFCESVPDNHRFCI